MKSLTIYKFCKQESVLYFQGVFGLANIVVEVIIKYNKGHDYLVTSKVFIFLKLKSEIGTKAQILCPPNMTKR